MAAGDLDTTFDTDGLVTTGFSGGGLDQAFAVALQADGRIVAAGRANNGVIGLARFNTNGSLDGGFGSGGKVTTSIGGFNDKANGVAIQADGRVVIAGETNTAGFATADFVVARYTSAGVLDTTFDGDGIATTDFGSSIDRGYATATL
jgi:uncharacterized delta-60 repeat protein